MPTILKTKSVYFNDVNLIPKLGVVKSRKDVPNEIHRIIVSPMVSVIGDNFIIKASQLGLSVAIPRFLPIENKLRMANYFERYKVSKEQLCFISIGLNEKEEDLEKLIHNTVYNNSILFDQANGYLPQIKECVEKVAYEFPIKNLMIGNVVTSLGLAYLHSELNNLCSNLFCRIGIGNGAPCSSSDVAAVNRGQITELMECEELKKLINNKYIIDKINKSLNIVSDGGISKSGFCVKAFGAGADYCLMGSYFSKAFEAETHISGDGTYFGCASEKQNKLAGLDKHSEGKIKQINKEELQDLEYLARELWGGISSGISYSGHDSVTNFIGNGVFEIKINSLPPKNRS